MRWGARKQNAASCAQEQGEEFERKSKGKAFSFSPLSWFAKLTAKPKAAAIAKAASPKHAPSSTPKNGAGATPALPSCLRKRTSPARVVIAPGRPSSPRRSPAATIEVVPRRLSVGNDNADAAAARQHCRPRRHCSLGSDRELLPLGHLIPFSLAGSPAEPPPPRAGAAPSDTDAGARLRRRRRRLQHPRRSLSGGRRSLSGRMPQRVKVRSPRRAPELERFAVVRRTRDPQRAFRESMLEMISASSSGGVAARPEELERLLACYLSLNADEHHDCIVKVFRQVWFEYINLLPRLARR